MRWDRLPQALLGDFGGGRQYPRRVPCGLQAPSGPAKVAVEACWNWGKLHDILEEMPEVEEIVLSHPCKTRIIAESQIKTDKLDARKLAELLRGKGANHAITRVARRMCQIVWQFPRDKRPYKKLEYTFTMIFPERSGLRDDGLRQTA